MTVRFGKSRVLIDGDTLTARPVVPAKAVFDSTNQQAGIGNLIGSRRQFTVTTPLARYDNRLFRLNVGFLLKESVGFTREFDFERDEPVRVDDIVVTRLHGKLRLTRARQGIVAQGKLSAGGVTDCVRCLASFEYHYEIEVSDLFVYPPPAPLNPQNWMFVDEGGFIDLCPLVREEGILAVPMQALCRPDCKGLCPQCGQNFNEETCDCVTEEIDPRLEGLRALLNEQLRHP